MKKRIVCILLCAAMLLTLAPMALAEETPENTEALQSLPLTGEVDSATAEAGGVDTTTESVCKEEQTSFGHVASVFTVSGSEEQLTLKKELFLNDYLIHSGIEDFCVSDNGIIYSAENRLYAYNAESKQTKMIADALSLYDLQIKDGYVFGIDSYNGNAQLVAVAADGSKTIATGYTGVNRYEFKDGKLHISLSVSEDAHKTLDPATGNLSANDELIPQSIEETSVGATPELAELDIPVVVLASTIQPALLDLPRLYVTQGANGSYSHTSKNAYDIDASTSGTANIKAPFDGTVKFIASDQHAIWFESNDVVQYANGTVAKLTVLTMHDNDVSDLYAGKVFSQGQVYTQEGTYGDATGTHMHIECINGTAGSYAWQTRGNVLPNDALYVTSSTRIDNAGGVVWRVWEGTPTPKYIFDLNWYVDSKEEGNGTENATADIYINGILQGNDVKDYYAELPQGTTYEIKNIKCYNGYEYVSQSQSLSGTLNGDTRIFVSIERKAYLDINGVLDGIYVGNCSEFATFDVYINGNKVADDWGDYYERHPVGTSFEVQDIKSKKGVFFKGVDTTAPAVVEGTKQAGGLSGTISSNGVYVCLSFSKLHTHAYTAAVTTEATCTEPGVKTYTCTECGDSYTEEIFALGHNLTHVPAIAPTTVSAGNVEYWRCSACNGHFLDADAATETTAENVILPKLDDPTPINPDATLTITGGKAQPGKTVAVSLALANNPGIAGMRLNLAYDSALTLTNVETADALSDLTFTKPGNLSANPVTLFWDGMDADATNGTILNLTFTVADGTADGEYPITVTYTSGEIYDGSMQDVTLAIKNGVVTVKNYILGDANGDDLVNGKDVTILRQFLTGGYGVTINELAADANRDGAANGKDVTVLRRYLAGGYGVTLE